MLPIAFPEFNPLPPSTSSSQFMCQDDSLLLTALKQSDNKAWDDCTNSVFRWVLPRVKNNHADAKDITQDTMTNLCRYLNTFRGDSSFTTWLFTIAHNTLVNWSRRQTRHKQGRHSLEEDLLPPSANWWERFELSETVTAVLDQLPSKDREILIQRYFDNLSYKDLAALHSIPETTVSPRLTTAKNRFRQLYHRLGLSGEYSETSPIR